MKNYIDFRMVVYENRTVFFKIGAYLLLVLTGWFIASRIANIPTRFEIILIVVSLSFIPVLKKPMWGVYCVLIVSLFVNFFRRLYYLLYERPKFDIFLILTDVILVLILLSVFLVYRKRGNPEIEVKIVYPIIIFLTLYQFARVFILSSYGVSEGLFQFKFNGLYFLLFFIAAYNLKEKGEIVRFFRITIICGTIVGLYALKQVILGYTDFEKIWFNSIDFTSLYIGGVPRPFSTLSSPATLADFLLICSVLLYCEIRWGVMNLRLWSSVLFPFFLIILLLTSVRSNWIGIIFGILFVEFFLKFNNYKNRVMMLIALILCFVLMSNFIDSTGVTKLSKKEDMLVKDKAKSKKIFNLMVKNRATALTDPMSEGSLKHRLALWNYVLITSLTSLEGFVGNGMCRNFTHNYYLGFLHSGGWIGFASILTIFFLIFKHGVRIHDQSQDEDKKITKILLCILFVIAIINLTGNHMETHPADIYFWILSAALLKFRYLINKETLTDQESHV